MFSLENKKVLVAFLFWEGGRGGGGGVLVWRGIIHRLVSTCRINEQMGHAAVSPLVCAIYIVRNELMLFHLLSKQEAIYKHKENDSHVN